MSLSALSAHPLPSGAVKLGAAHSRRLRQLWRQGGWPCHDALELDLVAAGLVEQAWDAMGRLQLRLSPAGVQLLQASLQVNRRAFDAHEALVGRVADHLQRAGRVAWRGLSMRAPLPAPDEAAGGDRPGESPSAADSVDPVEDAGTSLPGGTATLAADQPSSAGDDLWSALDEEAGLPAGPAQPRRRWAMVMPDVFSIRLTSVEDYLDAAVHEIKVSRADLLSDLRKPDKGRAYLALAGQCWYVLAAGIAMVDEIPPEYGVMFAYADRLEVARAAPCRAMRLAFAQWMVLARATPCARPEDERQAGIDAENQPPSP